MALFYSSVGDEKVMENKKSRERTVSICSSTGVLEKGGSDDTVLINRQVSDEMLIQTYKKVGSTWYIYLKVAIFIYKICSVV